MDRDDRSRPSRALAVRPREVAIARATDRRQQRPIVASNE
jgi:hypothetical protein